MKSYVISVLLVSVLGSVVSMLAPEGEGGGLGRHTRLAVGLCLIITVAYPLAGLVECLRGLDLSALIPLTEAGEEEYESIFLSSLESAERENLCEGIKDILEKNFAVSPEECRVDLNISRGEDGERRLTRVLITLYGSAVWKDTGAMEDYLSSLLGCEVISAVG